MFNFTKNTNRLKEFINNIKNKKYESRSDFNILFEESQDLAFEYLKYYDAKREGKKWSSFWYRQFIWLFGLLGLSLPILGMVFEMDRFTGIKVDYIEIGYGFIMLTAVLFSLKNFTGASKGHSRYVKTQLNLERIITFHTLDWHDTLSYTNDTLTKVDKEKLHKVIFRFMYKVYAEILKETNQWDKDYHNDENGFKEFLSSKSSKKD